MKANQTLWFTLRQQNKTETNMKENNFSLNSPQTQSYKAAGVYLVVQVVNNLTKLPVLELLFQSFLAVKHDQKGQFFQPI